MAKARLLPGLGRMGRRLKIHREVLETFRRGEKIEERPARATVDRADRICVLGRRKSIYETRNDPSRCAPKEKRNAP
jgi:hypothetical protein